MTDAHACGIRVASAKISTAGGALRANDSSVGDGRLELPTSAV